MVHPRVVRKIAGGEDGAGNRMKQALKVLWGDSLLLACVWIMGGFMAALRALLDGYGIPVSLTALLHAPLAALYPAMLYGMAYDRGAQLMGVPWPRRRVFLISLVLFSGSALIFSYVADVSQTKFFLFGSREIGFSFLLVVMFILIPFMLAVLHFLGLLDK
jgi:hypothetical protein